MPGKKIYRHKEFVLGKTWNRREKRGGGSRRSSQRDEFGGYADVSGSNHAPSMLVPRRHTDEKPDNITGEQETGTVTKFENGFGFIRRDNGGKDSFVHHSNISMDGFRKLNKGDRVRFAVERGPRGLQAVSVELTESSPAYDKAQQ